MRNTEAEYKLTESLFPLKKTLANNMSDTMVKNAPITKESLLSFLYMLVCLEEDNIKNNRDRQQYNRQRYNSLIPLLCGVFGLFCK